MVRHARVGFARHGGRSGAAARPTAKYTDAERGSPSTQAVGTGTQPSRRSHESGPSAARLPHSAARGRGGGHEAPSPRFLPPRPPAAPLSPPLRPPASRPARCHDAAQLAAPPSAALHAAVDAAGGLQARVRHAPAGGGPCFLLGPRPRRRRLRALCRRSRRSNSTSSSSTNITSSTSSTATTPLLSGCCTACSPPTTPATTTAAAPSDGGWCGRAGWGRRVGDWRQIRARVHACCEA